MISTNIVTVAFNGKLKAYAARALFQRDRGQILQFTDLDLPASYQVWFSTACCGLGEAVPQVGNESGVSIPDALIATGQDIYAWVYLQTGESDAETVRTAVILNTPQPPFTGATPTPAQATALDEAIAALNEAAEGVPSAIDTALAEAKASGEFDGAPGEDGNGIWWTTGPIAKSSGIITAFASSLLGRTDATPAVDDFVYGPPATGNPSTGAPTFLYRISRLVSSGSVVHLSEIGSMKGTNGDAATVSVGTTTTLPAGSDATVTNDGTSSAAVLNFGIPTGKDGAPGHGITDDLRAALIQLAAKVAYIDDGGTGYYQDLYDALYSPSDIDSISAVFNQGTNKVYSTASLDDLKPMLTVFALYDDNTSEVTNNYTLTGTLNSAISTITVSYLGKTTTFTVNVTVLSSISAVFTQGSNAVYDSDRLDSLKRYLAVTATYADGTTETLGGEDYTLSGTLAVGTSTITAAYYGKTDTFTVTVSAGLPTGYKRVEYIERPVGTSLSAGYNSTGVQLNGTDDVIVKIGCMATGTPSSDSGGFFIGCRQASSSNTIGFGVYVEKSLNTIGAFDGRTCLLTQPGGVLSKAYDLEVTKTTAELAVTDGTLSNTASGTARAMATALYLFGAKNHSKNELLVPCYGRIYYLQITEGNVKKLDLVASVRESDSAAGFFDLVSETFLTTQAYVAGPEF